MGKEVCALKPKSKQEAVKMSTNVALALVPPVQAEQPAPLTVAQKLQQKLEELMVTRTQPLRKEVEAFTYTLDMARQKLEELRGRKFTLASQLAETSPSVEALRTNAEDDQDLLDLLDAAEADMAELRATDAALALEIAELEGHIALTQRTIEAKQAEIVQTEQRLRAALQPKPVVVAQPEPERFLEPAALPTAGVKVAPVADVKAGLAIALANKEAAKTEQKPAQPQWPGDLPPRELNYRLERLITMLTNTVGTRDTRLSAQEIGQVASYCFFAAMYSARSGLVTFSDTTRLERLLDGHEVPEGFEPLVIRDTGDKEELTGKKIYICSAPAGIPCCSHEKTSELRHMVHGTTVYRVCRNFGVIARAVVEQIFEEKAKFMLSTESESHAMRFVEQNAPYVPKKLVGRKVVEREEGGRVVGDTGKTERKRAAKMLRQAENDRIEKEQADRRRAEREQKEREKAAKDALAKGKGKGGKNK
jgi:hypothetical protein